MTELHVEYGRIVKHDKVDVFHIEYKLEDRNKILLEIDKEYESINYRVKRSGPKELDFQNVSGDTGLMIIEAYKRG